MDKNQFHWRIDFGLKLKKPPLAGHGLRVLIDVDMAKLESEAVLLKIELKFPLIVSLMNCIMEKFPKDFVFAISAITNCALILIIYT